MRTPTAKPSRQSTGADSQPGYDRLQRVEEEELGRWQEELRAESTSRAGQQGAETSKRGKAAQDAAPRAYKDWDPDAKGRAGDDYYRKMVLQRCRNYEQHFELAPGTAT